ncbi:hypothetical protein BDV27DRAFT_120188 [Aspergillus caelatus]|uniref:Uncharacterized protein n=1 Tax=Aspergillus caelatus TaxID=61420 RepID=A0A5N7AJW9_9EURO|nr:uncharacterized protein BDV27DRAFT_120188 [Aspergillus caelatus]KAE8369993.1 hypothetical protein BDV27DRAFT_120188 [Aspergillus caelatus]
MTAQIPCFGLSVGPLPTPCQGWEVCPCVCQNWSVGVDVDVDVYADASAIFGTKYMQCDVCQSWVISRGNFILGF